MAFTLMTLPLCQLMVIKSIFFNDKNRTIAYIENPSSKEENIEIYPYAWKKSNTLPSDKNFQKKFMLL